MELYTVKETPSKLLINLKVGKGDRKSKVKMIAYLLGYVLVMVVGWFLNPMTLVATTCVAFFAIPAILKMNYGVEHWVFKRDAIGLQKYNGIYRSKLTLFDFEQLDVNYLPIKTSTEHEAVLKLRLDAKTIASDVRLPLEDIKSICKKIAEYYSVS